MKSIGLLLLAAALAHCTPLEDETTTTEYYEETTKKPHPKQKINSYNIEDQKIAEDQARNAKYSFASNIEDSINGGSHEREEHRDGLTVKGRYSYSDGFAKRTVEYIADDKGYRILSEKVEPLAEVSTNPNGVAKVSSSIAGKNLNYEINGSDVWERKVKAKRIKKVREEIVE